jgi:hypothetical protein
MQFPIFLVTALASLAAAQSSCPLPKPFAKFTDLINPLHIYQHFANYKHMDGLYFLGQTLDYTDSVIKLLESATEFDYTAKAKQVETLSDMTNDYVVQYVVPNEPAPLKHYLAHKMGFVKSSLHEINLALKIVKNALDERTAGLKKALTKVKTTVKSNLAKIRATRENYVKDEGYLGVLGGVSPCDPCAGTCLAKTPAIKEPHQGKRNRKDPKDEVFKEGPTTI